MNTRINNSRNAVVVLATLLTVTVVGCAGRGLIRQEYVLNPTPSAEKPIDVTAGTREIAVGVGPISLPSYLRRPQIVTRVGDNKLDASDTHSWAEDLTDSFTRVVMQNLVSMVPTVQVAGYPIASPIELDYRVAISVNRYERDDSANAVVLSAGWIVMRAKGGNVLVARQVLLREPMQGDSYPEVVAAMSRASATLSREIADAIRADASGAARR